MRHDAFHDVSTSFLIHKSLSIFFTNYFSSCSFLFIFGNNILKLLFLKVIKISFFKKKKKRILYYIPS